MSNKALKAFMKNNFDFSGLKKMGAYPKDMKHTDYEGQAKRICQIFSLKSIYDYGKHEIRCHISYVREGDKVGLSHGREVKIDNDGKLIEPPPFVETIFPNQMHI